MIITTPIIFIIIVIIAIIIIITIIIIVIITMMMNIMIIMIIMIMIMIIIKDTSVPVIIETQTGRISGPRAVSGGLSTLILKEILRCVFLEESGSAKMMSSDENCNSP